MVYWITGLSGAGKTTIGKQFYYYLKDKEKNTVFFDGDTLREVFGADLGYSEEDRRKCAMRYSRLCRLMDEQAINVVICTISMFDGVREWNRNNIKNYFEIYVKASLDTLKKRDQKGLYSGTSKETDKTVSGVDFIFEEPKCPDLVLVNDGKLAPEQQVEIIKNAL